MRGRAFVSAAAAVGIAASLGLGLRAGAEDAPKGKAFPQVEVLYNTLESHKQIAEALVQMWKKELGVTVGLGNTEFKVYLDRMSALDYQLARSGWVWDYNDPHNMFECWTTGNGNNRTGWSSKRYDELMAKAMTIRDNSERWNVYQDAEKILAEDCPILPIYYYVNKNMLNPKVKGWKDNVLNLHPYDALWISDKAGKEAPQDQQKLIFNNGAEPQTLDPALMSSVPDHRIGLTIFEGLMRLHPETLAPLPGVAESHEVSADGKTYTFHLRADARWSNGEPVTAEDFVWSWKRVIDPNTAAEYAQVFGWIEGANAVLRNEKGCSLDRIGLEAKDPRTLVVKLVAPCPFFLNLCAFETFMPVHRKCVEKHGLQWTRPENLVGNGPFVLSKWEPNAKLVVVPNPTYWGKDRVKLQEVTFLPIDNLDTGFNKFIAGEVDWIDDVPPARAEDVRKHPHFRATPFLAIYYYRFNCTKPPFDDVRVRKAFCMSVNKKTICRDVQRFGEMPANGVIPNRCGNPPYRSAPNLFPYDPEGARKLLREAGYEVKVE